MKKLFFITIICISFCSGIIAQDNKITIKEFYLDETDGTANWNATTVYDQNGEKCALIKIITNIDGFSFDVGVLGVVKTVSNPGEYWVYVPNGVKKITLHHKLYEQLEYQLPYTTMKAKTYKMVISSKMIFDNIVDDNTKQGHIKFEVSPSNANIILNYVPVALDNSGKGEIDLYYGRYTYNISAENYHTSVGKINVNEKNPSQLVSIRLRQNFGWLKLRCKEGIDSTTSIYIDENKISVSTIDSIPVKAGNHSIKIANPLYQPYTDSFVMNDSIVVPIDITLVPNYGTVRFIADSICQIWCNNTFLGKGTWEGRLPVGNHIIECRADGHLPSTKNINITNSSFNEYTLISPTPTYGAVEINSNPQGADVYIDDVLYGQTPIRKNNILVGKRKITLRSANFSTKSFFLEVHKDSLSTASYTLRDKVYVTINSSPSNSALFLNDEFIGKTPFSDSLIVGKYLLKVYGGEKYKSINSPVFINSDNNQFNYSLRKDFTRDKELYFDINSQLSINDYAKDNSILGMHLGAYIHNANIELGIEMQEPNRHDIIFNNPDYSFQKAYIADYFNLIGKVGYSFIYGNRCRITPQIGVQYNMPKAFMFKDNIETKLSAFSFCTTASCRISYALLPFMGISMTPSYKIQLKESSFYKIASELIPSVKASDRGLSINIGLVFFINI